MKNTIHFSFDVPKENKHLIDILNALSKAFNLKSGIKKETKNEDRLKRFLKHSSGIDAKDVLRGEELKEARYKKYAK